MVQLSKREISEEVWDQTWEWLVYVIGVNNTAEGVNVLLSGLLTKTERIMVAKRLMMGILMLSGWSPKAISEELALSVSTVYKLREMLEANEEYRELLTDCFGEMVEQENGGSEGRERIREVREIMKKSTK